jgi:hypothetical protein
MHLQTPEGNPQKNEEAREIFKLSSSIMQTMTRVSE